MAGRKSLRDWCTGILLVLLIYPALATAQDGDELILLVATPQLEGSFFERSVVLVAPQYSGAAVGVILNRPIAEDAIQLHPQDEMLRELGPIHLGGPVSPNQLIYLFRSEDPPEQAIHLLEDVYFSDNLELLSKQLRRPRKESRLQLYIGYSGWSVGQLQEEILRGSWDTLRATPKLIFDSDPESIWFQLTHNKRDDWI